MSAPGAFVVVALGLDGDPADDLQSAIRIEEDSFAHGAIVVVRGVGLDDDVDATRAVRPGSGDALIIDVLTCAD